jgi:hypothetical protein
MGKYHTNSKMRTGFTVIEVILFVAISAALIMGLIIGTSTSIARQRYTDAVQDLADWIKNEYYAVSNPDLPDWDGADLLDFPVGSKTCGFNEPVVGKDSSGAATSLPRRRGQSRCQLYGKLITFGENGDQNRVNSYLVTGMDGRSGDIKGENPLSDLKVSNMFIPSTQLSDHYYIPYSASAQGTAANQPLKAAILLVRPPLSGGVRTLVATQPFGAAYSIDSTWQSIRSSHGDPSGIFPAAAYTSADGFKLTGDLSICVGSEDVFAIGGKRREIRIKAGGGNASAVEIVAAGESTCL